jgi:chemotaxis protein CheD
VKAAPSAARLDAARVVGIGQYAVTGESDGLVLTHALGSCVAVCIWDPVTHVGGLLHFLLPDSAISPERARTDPGAFADTGLPALFHAAYAVGLDKARCVVRLVGGAEVAGLGSLDVGRRNTEAARRILARNGLTVRGEATGGHTPRSVMLQVRDGQVIVMFGRQVVQVL